MFPTSNISILAAAIQALEANNPTEAQRLVRLVDVRLDLAANPEPAPSQDIYGGNCTDRDCACNTPEPTSPFDVFARLDLTELQRQVDAEKVARARILAVKDGRISLDALDHGCLCDVDEALCLVCPPATCECGSRFHPFDPATGTEVCGWTKRWTTADIAARPISGTAGGHDELGLPL